MLGHWTYSPNWNKIQFLPHPSHQKSIKCSWEQKWPLAGSRRRIPIPQSSTFLLRASSINIRGNRHVGLIAKKSTTVSFLFVFLKSFQKIRTSQQTWKRSSKSRFKKKGLQQFPNSDHPKKWSLLKNLYIFSFKSFIKLWSVLYLYVYSMYVFLIANWLFMHLHCWFNNTR